MAMQNNRRNSVAQHWHDYQPTKTTLVWACAGTALATMIIGFASGGWVTGGTSRDMATTAGNMARGELAGDICVERFNAAPDSAAKLVEFKAMPNNYRKQEFVEAGGWATMPGQSSPDKRGAEACAVALAT